MLTKAIKLDPKTVDAYWCRGSCYDRKNNHTAAIRDWTEVGRLNPTPEKIPAETHGQAALGRKGKERAAIEEACKVVSANGDAGRQGN